MKINIIIVFEGSVSSVTSWVILNVNEIFPEMIRWRIRCLLWITLPSCLCIESAFMIFYSRKSRSRETEIQMEQYLRLFFSPGRDEIRLWGLKAAAAVGLWKRRRTGFFPTSFIPSDVINFTACCQRKVMVPVKSDKAKSRL